MTLPYGQLLVPLGHEQPEGVCSNSRTATTSPANSWPGMIGKGVGGDRPAAMLRSEPQTPTAPTLITTPPELGVGSGLCDV